RSRAAISPSAIASAAKSWRLARHWRASPKMTIVAKPAIGTTTGISVKSARAGPTTTAAVTPAIAANPAATSAPIICRPRSWGWTRATPTIGRTTANASPTIAKQPARIASTYSPYAAARRNAGRVRPIRTRKPTIVGMTTVVRSSPGVGVESARAAPRPTSNAATGARYRIDRMAGPSAVVEGSGRGRSAPSPGRSRDWGIGTELPHEGDWVAGQKTGLDLLEPYDILIRSV